MTWHKAVQLARKHLRHQGSCWTTGGPELCERCAALAHELLDAAKESDDSKKKQE